MTTRRKPAAPSARRPTVGRILACPPLTLAALLTLSACQPGESPRESAPAAAPATVPDTLVRATDTAANALPLQYQDAGALRQNGFQITEDGGIVPLDQFERWTPTQLRELLQFVDAPNSGLSAGARSTLRKALRDALAAKKGATDDLRRTPAAPPRVAP